MTDSEQLKQLLDGHHPCISIVTQEEVYMREIVVGLAVELQLDLKTWTISECVRDGLMADCPGLEDTENPAAALVYLAHQDGRFIAMVLDMAVHLREPRALRAMRDLNLQVQAARQYAYNDRSQR